MVQNLKFLTMPGMTNQKSLCIGFTPEIRPISLIQVKEHTKLLRFKPDSTGTGVTVRD
jgi:hypothetical protein